ncbi:MAG: hypothetical protein IIA87_05780 [Nanoarchaeota archaeon]|nr:hypothetical protein [Nanoarchaeota archaeon]
MATEILSMLVMGSVLLGIILLALIFVWVLRTPEKHNNPGKIKEDLKKIKDQINGNHD